MADPVRILAPACEPGENGCGTTLDAVHLPSSRGIDAGHGLVTRDSVPCVARRHRRPLDARGKHGEHGEHGDEPRLSARSRRSARTGSRRGPGVPHRIHVAARVVPRHLDVLHAVGLPDHHPAPPGAPTLGTDRPQRLLGPSFPAASPRIARGHRGHRAGGGGLADSGQLERLRGDVLAALAYVANWHFIASGDSYGALFAAKPPMEHFWSLAIEEQFYFVYPLVAVGLLACFRGSTARVRGGAVGVDRGIDREIDRARVAGCSPRPSLFRHRRAPAAEILLGCLVAVVWMRYGDRIGAGGRRLVGRLGAVAFVAMLVSSFVAQRRQ